MIVDMETGRVLVTKEQFLKEVKEFFSTISNEELAKEMKLELDKGVRNDNL